MQADKPDSVHEETKSTSCPYHLSRRSVTAALELPTLSDRAGTLEPEYTWHFTA